MRDIYRVIGAVLVTIVAALGIGALLHVFMSLSFEATSANDKRAEWVGAMGTVATLAGTIWLATSEARQRHKNQLLLARLRGASILFRICHANEAAINLRRLMENATLGDPPLHRLMQCRDILESIENWTMEDLVALVPLRNHVAVNLAESNDLLDLINRKIAVALTKSMNDVFTNSDWVLLARSCRHHIEEVILRTSAVISEVRHVSSKLRGSSE